MNINTNINNINEENNKINESELSKIEGISKKSIMDILNIKNINELSTDDFLYYLSTLDGEYNEKIFNDIDERFYKLISKFDNIHDNSNEERFEYDYIDFEEINKLIKGLAKIGIENSEYNEKVKQIDNFLFLTSRLGFSFKHIMYNPSDVEMHTLFTSIKEGEEKGIDFFDIRLIFAKYKNILKKIVDKKQNGRYNFEEYGNFFENINNLLNEENSVDDMSKYDIREYLDELRYLGLKRTLDVDFERSIIKDIGPYTRTNILYRLNEAREIYGLDEKGFDIDALEQKFLSSKKRIYIENFKSNFEIIKLAPTIGNIEGFLSKIDYYEKELLADNENEDLNKDIISILNKFRANIAIINYYTIFDEKNNEINQDDSKELLESFENEFKGCFKSFPDRKDCTNLKNIENVLGEIKYGNESDMINIFNKSMQILKLKK
ncbi:hypothetical protein [Candidatus Vampirococcus lugosii]|uniref:RNA polymerase alpha subunit C-terminal domain-containing protein n=1 Tax=Candidatus Vampirococcus lugosii TaxID=2789015 RepID=A0ABS5QPH6_9BACT|nr:hypothetical protein [Candidatus Vampirococcus lugosii]MBS8122483.1 hypothetical protein [Candidatus Vampirococcus lugosii]